MSRAAIGEDWRTASELGVRALATNAPIWAGKMDDAWRWLATPSKQGKGGIAVESRVIDGEKRYRASGSATPLPSGMVLDSAIERRLDYAIDYLLNNCDGGTHPGGHTAEAIEAVPTIAAARAWLAERKAAGGMPAPVTAPASAEPATDDAGDGWGAPREHDEKRNKAVELRAMEVAARCYREQGWRVEDVSATESYDLRCTRDNDELHVEVKGTTGAGAVVTLTPNEVEHARERRTALFVLSHIEVSYTDDGEPTASGGRECVLDPWDIDGEGELRPSEYRYRLPDRC